MLIVQDVRHLSARVEDALFDRDSTLEAEAISDRRSVAAKCLPQGVVDADVLDLVVLSS
jgi:hypothetical protein